MRASLDWLHPYGAGAHGITPMKDEDLVRYDLRDATRLAWQAQQNTRNPNFAAILPLDRPDRLDREDLIARLRALVEPAGAQVHLDPLEGIMPLPKRSFFGLNRVVPQSVLLQMAGVKLLISLDPSPLTEAGGVHAYLNPMIWQRGVAPVVEHRAHATIVELGLADNFGIEEEDGIDAVFDRATAVTLAASVVADMLEPTAVLWLPARNALPMPAFRDAVADMQAGAAPLTLWLRWHQLPTENPLMQPGLATNGLLPFVGREIMAPPSATPLAEMLGHVFKLACRLVNTQGAPVDGEVLDPNGPYPCRVRVRRRTVWTDTPTYELAALADHDL